ncbi:MAG: NAD(P)H-hydrate dehydratase [Candidatus Magasanikbacteria bacterium CG10_big_fil_rev_8_21_14_0_10_43_6]|uniref:ADP-dependent (S)-NAD(P)H-hydrate dehydratase n=1 Tax=Candidatus Magasanikbacteria bacterium CG10_big_fil_rev_8_21_14_0_10_43_6 TaxID=1974650 RepID=A0A2M6W076_9BACT|nr:MAG: NAD(P)H-hydrate dehydratase [Candidatus Magasanikbacteria bacterium CG10_big_fil_rev_8_21_14_0_10_43_6]
MTHIDTTIFQELSQPARQSHKGQNGRMLIIAGSEKFHGALLLAVETAARLVDMVYVHSTKDNLKLIKKLRSEVSTFIAVSARDLWETIGLVDVVLMGPGLPENGKTIGLVHDILSKHPEKKTVVDATAIWHVRPECLHENCIVTPHSREFENMFGVTATAAHVHSMAQKYKGIVALKGYVDYVSDGVTLYENHTGNPGMTKGGTGDVFAGTIAALATKNDTLTATLAGAHLVGLAGDGLYEKKGTFFNAEDLIQSMGDVWGMYMTK